MKTDNILLEKSKQFAIRIIRLCQYLRKEKKEFIISDQIFRSGTSIGANSRESRRAQGTKDFIYKLYVALKEADETAYWLEIIMEAGILTSRKVLPLHTEACELRAIILTTIRSSRDSNPQISKSPNP